jgi:hypothetical protein
MSPLNAAICTTTYLERQKCYSPDKEILFRKQLFDLEVKGQKIKPFTQIFFVPFLFDFIWGPNGISQLVGLLSYLSPYFFLFICDYI